MTVTGLAVASASLVSVPAVAATSVNPAESGTPPVVRDSSVTVSVDRAAYHYARSSASANFAAASATAVGLAGCKGDVNGAGNSPRTAVKVTGPDGTTLLEATSPVRDMSLGSFGGSAPRHKPLNPQPAGATGNYRGDFPDSDSYHGFSAQLSLAGKPSGTYTITTTDSSTVRTGLGACSFGRPGVPANTIVTGPLVTTQTFEYRPWQFAFRDILGKGRVSLNATPGEVQFAIGAKTSPIYGAAGGAKLSFFALPVGSAYALPSDPADCVTDISSCLPSDATSCNPATGCTPRLAFVNRAATVADGNQLAGMFDLSTRAFIANAKVDGSSRLLLSLGAENDPIYDDVIEKLSTGAAAQGIDLPSILATEVVVGDHETKMTASLLNGMQIDPSSGPGGVQISSNATAQAGIVLHIYTSLQTTGDPCSSTSGSSTSEPNRYTRSASHGYNVTKSDLLPKVPEVGALGAIVGGPLYHITGTFRPDPLINTASAVIGLDTAADEPNGYPVWIEPFLSSPTHVSTPKKMDFLGTGTWSASETPIGSDGCLVFDLLVGTGVAVFNNPLPVGLGTIFDPLAKPTPAAEQLTDKVSEVLDDVTGQATSNPTVASLLDQLTALLPLA